ncbi:MAG: hypothetical protein WCK58_16580, partial [Chloroflexota bacterium]
FTDAMGRRLPLGAAVVVMTSSTAVGGLSDAGLLAACDLVVEAPPAETAGEDDVLRVLLTPLATRFARNGITVTFDAAFSAWVAARIPGGEQAALDWLDRELAPALVASMPEGATELVARVDGDRPVLAAPAATGGSAADPGKAAS